MLKKIGVKSIITSSSEDILKVPVRSSTEQSVDVELDWIIAKLKKQAYIVLFFLFDCSLLLERLNIYKLDSQLVEKVDDFVGC